VQRTEFREEGILQGMRQFGEEPVNIVRGMENEVPHGRGYFFRWLGCRFFTDRF
jgi:hypothetical protein